MTMPGSLGEDDAVSSPGTEAGRRSREQRGPHFPINHRTTTLFVRRWDVRRPRRPGPKEQETNTHRSSSAPLTTDRLYFSGDPSTHSRTRSLRVTWVGATLGRRRRPRGPVLRVEACPHNSGRPLIVVRIVGWAWAHLQWRRRVFDLARQSTADLVRVVRLA